MTSERRLMGLSSLSLKMMHGLLLPMLFGIVLFPCSTRGKLHENLICVVSEMCFVRWRPKERKIEEERGMARGYEFHKERGELSKERKRESFLVTVV